MTSKEIPSSISDVDGSELTVEGRSVSTSKVLSDMKFSKNVVRMHLRLEVFPDQFVYDVDCVFELGHESSRWTATPCEGLSADSIDVKSVVGKCFVSSFTD